VPMLPASVRCDSENTEEVGPRLAEIANIAELVARLDGTSPRRPSGSRPDPLVAVVSHRGHDPVRPLRRSSSLCDRSAGHSAERASGPPLDEATCGKRRPASTRGSAPRAIRICPALHERERFSESLTPPWLAPATRLKHCTVRCTSDWKRSVNATASG